MRVPGEPVKGVPGDTMLSLLGALFSDLGEIDIGSAKSCCRLSEDLTDLN